MAKYLVTGGNGFIGSHLVAELSKRGQVVAYDNCSSGKRDNTTHLYEGDILDIDRLTKAMNGCDVVFHLAANTNTRAGMINPKLDLFNGLVGTYNVLLAMRANGIKKLVHASTCGVYGESPNPAVETQEMKPICHYADNKMKAEWLIEDFVKRYGMQAWVYRFGNVVGGIMQNGVIRDLIRKLKADKTKLEVLGSKKPSRPFLCVEDCASAILFGFDKTNEKYNVFNIAGSGSTDIGTIVKLILKETHLEDIPVTYEKQDRGWEGSAVEVCISANKLKELGWEASMSSDKAVKKAIREIMEYEKFAIK
jgi:UDP-glucose 4-epimerase